MTVLAVLLYHDICGSKNEIFERQNPLYTTDLDRLRWQLDWLSAEGYKTLLMSDLVSAKQQGKVLPDKTVVLTFDGSFSGWALVHEELSKRRMKAVYYITTDWIEDQHIYPGENGVGWALLNEISASELTEIGSHTVTHSPFVKQDNESIAEFENRIRSEMVRSKDVLEQGLGKNIQHFASPWGQGVQLLLEQLARETGYVSIRGIEERIERLESLDLMNIGIAYSDRANLARWRFSSALRAHSTNRLFKTVGKIRFRIENRIRHTMKLDRKYMRKIKFEHEEGES